MAWVVVWACVGAALTQGLPLDHSPSPRGFIGFSFWPPAPDVAPVECAAANTLLPRGTCFKEDDCVKAGGVASGNCPSGGVCCVVPVLCGGEAKINNTWFVNKDFPAGTRDPASCIIRIKRSKAEVVQARLDLELMDLGEPVRGRCQGDALSITRPGAPAALTPTLCGNNSRQHLYVDLMPGEVEVRVRLDNAQLLPRQAVPQRQWKVLITQHTQKEAAPHGCLQYFRQARSTVRSLNYDSGLHLGDALNYDVCFSKLARSQKSDEACNRHFNDVNMEQRSLESVLPRNQPATKIRKTNRHGSSSRGREGNNNSGRGKNGNRSSGRGRNGTSNRRRFGRSASQPQTRQYREESDPKQYTEEDRVNFGVLDVLNLVNRTVEEVRVSGNTDQVDHNTIPLIDFPQNDIDDTPAEVTHPEDTIQENAILPDSAPMDSNIESSSPEDNNLLHVTPDQPITEARPIQLVPLVQSQTNEGVITQIQNVINQLQEKQKLQQQKDEEKTEGEEVVGEQLGAAFNTSTSTEAMSYDEDAVMTSSDIPLTEVPTLLPDPSLRPLTIAFDTSTMTPGTKTTTDDILTTDVEITTTPLDDLTTDPKIPNTTTDSDIPTTMLDELTTTTCTDIPTTIYDDLTTDPDIPTTTDDIPTSNLDTQTTAFDDLTTEADTLTTIYDDLTTDLEIETTTDDILKTDSECLTSTPDIPTTIIDTLTSVTILDTRTSGQDTPTTAADDAASDITTTLTDIETVPQGIADTSPHDQTLKTSPTDTPNIATPPHAPTALHNTLTTISPDEAVPDAQTTTHYASSADALTMTAATVIRAPLTPPPDGQDTSLDVEVPPPVTTVSDMSGVPASPPDSEHWDMKDTLSANDKPFPILHVIDDDVDVVLEKLKDQFLTEYLVNGNRPTETVGDILMDTMGVGLPGDGDSWVTAGMVVSAGNPTVPYTPLNDDLTDNLESSTTDETAGFSETAGESHATNTPQALNIDKYSEETDSTTDTDDESVTFSEAIAMEELTTFSPVIIPEAISEPTTELIVTRVDDNVTTTSNTTIEGGGELPIPLSMDTEAPQKDTHTDPKETSPGEHDPTTTTDLLTKTITFTSITTATVPVATTTTRTLQKTSSATTMAPTVSFTTIVITPATTMVTNTGPAPSTTSTTHLFTIPGFVQPTTTPTLTIPGSVQPSTIDSIALTTTFAIHTTSVTTSLSQTAITTPTSVMPTTSSMTPTTTTTTDSPGTGRPMQVELTLTDPESVQIVGDLVMADHSQSSTSKPHPFLDDEIEWLILDGSETSISLPPDTMVSSGIGFPGEGGQGTAMSPEGDEAESGDVTTEALEANTTREEEGESSCAVCEPTTSDDLHVGGTENDTTADDLDYQTSDIPSSVAASDITGAEAVEASSLGPATATEATGSQGMTTPSVTNECFNASDVTTGHTTSTSVETSTGSVAESDGQGSPLTTSPTTSTNITTFPSTTSTSITTFPSTTSTNITTFPSTTSTNSPSTTTTPTSTSITTFPSTTSTSSPSTSSTTTSTSITTFPSTTSTNSPSTTTPTTSTSITTFPSTTSTTSPSTTTPTTSTSITTFPSTTSTNSPSTTTTPTSTSITTFPSTTSTSTTTTSPATTPTTTEGNMGVNINIKVQGANSQEEIDDTSENIDAVINLITNSDWEPPELDETESEENSDDEENDSDDFESVESEEENEPELVCGGAYVMVRQRMLCGGQLRHNLPGQDTTDDRFEDVERFSVRTLHGATRSLRFSMSYETKCPRAPPPPSTTPAPTRKTVTLLQYLLGWYR
ncbi:mucin-17-like isoform X1 [Eriocheir sinensis]|uniref:mucin-17-like isoform X1 n=1 Tax=Eriocheir sinensis TaxID=95602 RepID=UPI0021C8BFB2|nr:mucin-17-like isoform X1 [Eriocheir sinensis]